MGWWGVVCGGCVLGGAMCGGEGEGSGGADAEATVIKRANSKDRERASIGNNTSSRTSNRLTLATILTVGLATIAVVAGIANYQ